MTQPPDPSRMITALLDPVPLQVFAAMTTRTGAGRPSSWPSTGYELTYLTPTGAAKATGLSVEQATTAFSALQKARLTVPYPTNPKRNGWRLDTDSLTEATGTARHPSDYHPE